MVWDQVSTIIFQLNIHDSSRTRHGTPSGVCVCVSHWTNSQSKGWRKNHRLESNVRNQYTNRRDKVYKLTSVLLCRSTLVPWRRFYSEDVTILLTVSESTAQLNISNIQTFTIWCRQFAVFLTLLDLPTDVNIPRVVSSYTHLSQKSLIFLFAKNPVGIDSNTIHNCIATYGI